MCVDPCILPTPRTRTPNLYLTSTTPTTTTPKQALVTAERGKGLGRDEGVVGKGDEVELGDKTYWWHDKYRPRKPRYFNRVGWLLLGVCVFCVFILGT